MWHWQTLDELQDLGVHGDQFLHYEIFPTHIALITQCNGLCRVPCETLFVQLWIKQQEALSSLYDSMQTIHSRVTSGKVIMNGGNLT